jgi:hypothetical protein
MIVIEVEPTDETWLDQLTDEELAKYNADREYTLKILEVTERSLQF